MKEEDMNETEESTTNSKVGNNSNNHPFTTIPIAGNLQKSLPLMTEEQIGFNLIEIKYSKMYLSLVSMFNESILEKLYEWSIDTKFFMKNRYLLENIINNTSKNSSINKKDLREIVEKYDTIYVNGKILKEHDKDHSIIKHGLKKELRAKFITSREEFVNILEELSQSLKVKAKDFGDEEDLREYFDSQLHMINQCQVHATISPNKEKLLKDLSSDSISSQDSFEMEEISSQQSESTPKKKEKAGKNIFTMCFHDKVYSVKEINIANSSFIKTKNRFPLILDFSFAKFIYKNDDQLSHELIAISLIRYINRLLTGLTLTEQIISYEIIPEAAGAFYQFVDHSMTVGKIKSKFEGGIPEYLDFLEKQGQQSSVIKMSNIRKRFAETYAGFCIAQYLLELKDRNNENIMIRNDGSIFHIDLAFIFNATPGGIGFESAPFKFTTQYLDAMGGFDSDTFKYYESLMMSNLTKLTVNKDEFLAKIGILSARKDEILCFRKFKIEQYKSKIPNQPSKVKQTVEKLIDESFQNWRTKKYDDYQFKTNKILP